ncbi:MAG: hypothetical protein PVJ57_18255 [Phycisphaerae bacterium]|jgi:hypothetical protein
MRTICLIAVLLVIATGCETPLLENIGVGPRLDEIDAIRNDTGLTAQEKRTALADLGLSPIAINTVLDSIREANQYGGDLRTAYDKVVAGQFNQMTPDEVQVFGDAATEVGDDLDYELTDAEAQAVVTFFQDNDIATEDDLLDFLDVPANLLLIPSTIPEGTLNDLFVDFDPALLIPELP